MKITGAKVITCSPGRNFVTLKVTVEGGIYGLGDATLNGRELAVACYLTEHVIPCLIGREAYNIEDTWQYLYKGAYWRRGPGDHGRHRGSGYGPMWDILEVSRCNKPLYQLLGGASREGITVYGHASGQTIEETLEEAGKYLKQGYKAVRLQSGVPGIAKHLRCG